MAIPALNSPWWLVCDKRSSRCTVRRAGCLAFYLSVWAWSPLTTATAIEPPASLAESGGTAVESQPATLIAENPVAENPVAENPVAENREAEYRNELLRGRVVWLAEALKTRFGITSVPEVAEYGMALLTTDGRLVPIVENLRGRAFRKDPRLHEMDLEVLVRRYEHQPFVQVVKICEVDGEKRHEIDYWCDVCAIIMYEYGPCACCQDQNRLRKQLVPPTVKPPQ